jgi:predicted DNA-binding transcriptional regulator AlpA
MKTPESEWLGGAQLRRMLGITGMTLWRWEKDPELNFPRPTIIRERKYWSRAAINEWMRNAAVSKARRTRDVSNDREAETTA